jgi:hypothetical protein
VLGVNACRDGDYIVLDIAFYFRPDCCEDCLSEVLLCSGKTGLRGSYASIDYDINCITSLSRFSADPSLVLLHQLLLRQARVVGRPVAVEIVV